MNRTLFFPMIGLATLTLGVLGIIAALSFTTAASAQPPLACPANLRPDGLVSYWKLDEENPSTYEDSAGDNDATCTTGNCPASEDTGIVGGAQTFDGSTDALNVPDDDVFDWGPDESFSFELWMQGNDQTCAGSGNENNEVFIGRANDSDLQLWLGCLAGTKKAAFKVQDPDDSVLALRDESGPDLNDGEWHHIVGVHDATAGAIRLYVDGVERDTANVDYTTGFASDTDINIGWLELPGSVSNFNFNGTLDEVAVYNQALTPEEIERHYAYGDNAGLGYCVGEPGITLATEASPTVIRPGETVDFTYNVSLPDSSAIPLSNVVVNDATCSSTPLDTPASGDENTNSVLDPGEVWQFTCSAELSEDTNDTASASGSDPADETVASVATDTFIDVINPAIEIAKEAAASVVRAGATVTFTYTVTNTGDDPLTNIQVSDAACSPIESTESGALAAGAERVFTCATALTADTTSAATVEGTDSDDGTVEDTSAEVTVEVINPSLALTISVDKTEIDPNDIVTFTYRVTNTGDVELDNIVVEGDGTCSPITSTESGPLAVGAEREFTCTVALNDDTVTSATARATDLLGEVVESNQATATVNVSEAPG